MARIGKLTLDGQELMVLDFRSKIHQDVDLQGRRNSVPKGGMLRLTVEHSPACDTIAAWAAADKMCKDGEIVFKGQETSSAVLTVRFANALCNGHQVHFSAFNSEMMTVTFTISCQQLQMNQVTFENRW